MNGSTLGWNHLGLAAFYPSVSSNLDPLGSPSPFNTASTCIFGGNITSIATANLTSNVNGTTLECSNGSFVLNGTEIVGYDLILKGKTMLMEDLISVMLSGTCPPIILPITKKFLTSHNFNPFKLLSFIGVHLSVPRK